MKVGRNTACPCGSGQKFKRCCGQGRSQAFGPGSAYAQDSATVSAIRRTSLAEGKIDQLVALMRAGRYLDAERSAQQLVTQMPAAGIIWKLLGLSLVKQGKSSAHIFQRAAQLLPDDAETHFLLGNAFHNLGQYSPAAASYRRSLGKDPNLAEAYCNLGLALHNLGELREAVSSYQRAVQLAPNSATAHTNLGNVLRDLGQADEAIASHRRALEIEPRFGPCLMNLGNVFQDIARYEDAAHCYRQAIEAQPNFAAAHNGLGGALRDLGDLAASEMSFRQAVLRDPQYAAAHSNLAIVLRLQNRIFEAQQSCGKALQLNPDCAPAIAFQGEMHADLGQFAEAEALFRRAAKIAPGATDAWAAIAGLRKMGAEDAAWLTEAQRLVLNAVTYRQQISLCYAMGKYFDDLREFAQAFANYKRANELTQFCTPRYDRQWQAQVIDRKIKSYNCGWLQIFGGMNHSTRPIFIVGMPRSGTSLIEQILASHPAVFGAGELPFWTLAAAKYESVSSNGAPNQEMVREFANDYLRMDFLSGDRSRVVDKMPGNYLNLGLIHAALPAARIVHIRRDPIDTCLSIYFQNLDVAHGYANDLDDLAHYYEQYLRIMEHWRLLLPGRVLLELRYEDLIADQENWSRRILDFLGLPWDQRVMQFERTERVVPTRSRWQVRQKISSTSIARWQKYRQFIGPLARLGH